jgi:hypothetical protein
MPVKLTAELLQGRNPAGGPFYIPSQLVSLTNTLQNWSTFWKTYFIPQYMERIQQNFETEGELSGYMSGWPDLEPRYAAWKARHFPGRKILERTRRLRNSLAPGASGSDTLIQVRPLEVRIGSRVWYARYHTRTRPFLPRITKEEWTPIVRRWVRENAASLKMNTPAGAGA